MEVKWLVAWYEICALGRDFGPWQSPEAQGEFIFYGAGDGGTSICLVWKRQFIWIKDFIQSISAVEVRLEIVEYQNKRRQAAARRKMRCCPRRFPTSRLGPFMNHLYYEPVRHLLLLSILLTHIECDKCL